MAVYVVPRDFERRMVRSLKDTILRLALIDTGALYDSIEVGIEIFQKTPDSVDINILVYGEDYAKYLVEPFDILSTWADVTQFQTIIEDLLGDFVEWKIDTFGLTQYESLDWNFNFLLNNLEWFFEG